MLYVVAVLVAMQLHSASTQCTNGGQLVARGCTSSNQCTLYTSGPVTCLHGSCCTVPSSCSNGGNMVAIGCSQSRQCAQYSKEQTVCLSGKCCTVPKRCPNGGTVVALGCSSSQQCVAFANGVPVACVNGGLCCTV